MMKLKIQKKKFLRVLHTFDLSFHFYFTVNRTSNDTPRHISFELQPDLSSNLELPPSYDSVISNETFQSSGLRFTHQLIT